MLVEEMHIARDPKVNRKVIRNTWKDVDLVREEGARLFQYLADTRRLEKTGAIVRQLGDGFRHHAIRDDGKSQRETFDRDTKQRSEIGRLLHGQKVSGLLGGDIGKMKPEETCIVA